MGRSDLIGSGKHQLVPGEQKGRRAAPKAKFKGQTALTQHTGLPPRHHGKKAKPGAAKGTLTSAAANKGVAKSGDNKVTKSVAKPNNKRVPQKLGRR